MIGWTSDLTWNQLGEGDVIISERNEALAVVVRTREMWDDFASGFVRVIDVLWVDDDVVDFVAWELPSGIDMTSCGWSRLC